MPVELGTDLGLLVSRVVVEEDVDGLILWNIGFDGVQKADEFVVAVTLHVAPDHRAVSRYKTYRFLHSVRNGGNPRASVMPSLMRNRHMSYR